MMAGLLALLGTLIMVTQVMVGIWTSNNFLYKSSEGARGAQGKAKFDAGLNQVDNRLGNEKWVNDPAYGGNFQGAVTAIGSNPTVLHIPPGTWPIASDMTIPANITLKLARGAILNIASGKTLTINGPLEAGLYQIFSFAGTGKVAYKGKKYPEWWGAKDDSGTTNNTAAIAASLVNTGETEFQAPNGGYYKCASAIAVTTAGVRVVSHSGAEIKTAATGMHLFNVTASDVQFRGLKLTGLDTSNNGDWSGIYFPGTSSVHLSQLIVEDCYISRLCKGVFGTWNSFLVRNCTINDVAIGVVGGSWDAGSVLLDSTMLQQDVIGCYITCTFGNLDDSRPISVPYLQGGAEINGNYCRGGGMAIENVLDSTDFTAHNRVNVIDNNCDTAISASQGGKIIGNTIDLSQAPLGRGQQASYYEAIECGRDVLIANNSVKYHATAIAIAKPGCSVIGNKFYNIGRDSVGFGGAVAVYAYPDVDTDMNCLIEGNHFYNSGTAHNVICDIIVNLWGAVNKVRGVSITGNYSYNCSYIAMALAMLDGKVADNYIFNAWKYGTYAPFGMLSNASYNTIEFTNNTFINTLAGPQGMEHGISSNAAGDIIGFNKYVGLRGTPIAGAAMIGQSQMADGAFWSPKKSNFTAAEAATTTVNNTFVTATCQIRLEPTNAAAATLMGGAKALYISAKNARISFVVSTANGANAAGTETFNYEIMD